MEKCKKCGKELESGELVCPSCGEPVVNDAPSDKTKKKSKSKKKNNSAKKNTEQTNTDKVEDKKEELEQVKKGEIESTQEVVEYTPTETIKEAQVVTQENKSTTNVTEQKVETKVQPTVTEPAPNVQQPVQPATLQPNTYYYDNQYNADIDKVVSVWGFLLNMLVLLIPVVGLIVAMVWVLGGSKNQNRINMAKAYLVIFIICLGGLIVGGVTLKASGGSISSITYKVVDKSVNGFFSKHKIRTFNDFVDIYYKIEHFDELEKKSANTDKTETKKQNKVKDDEKSKDKVKDEQVKDDSKNDENKKPENAVPVSGDNVVQNPPAGQPQPPAPNINYYYYYYPAPQQVGPVSQPIQ